MALGRSRFAACTLAAFALAFAVAFPFAIRQALADEGDLLAGGSDLLAGAETEMFAQATTWDYETPDGLASVDGIKKGQVSYDQKAKVLTLSSVNAAKVNVLLDEDLTLALVGESSLDFVWGSEGTLTIQGEGSLAACIDTSGDLVMREGALTARATKANSLNNYFGVSCSTLYMEGGELIASGTAPASGDDCGVGVNCWKDLRMTGGTLSATGKTNGSGYCACGVSCCEGGVFVSGGTLTAIATAKESSYAAAVQCAGNVKVSGGTLSASASSNGPCHPEGISCEGSVIVAGGKLNADATASKTGGPTGVICGGNLKVSKGEASIVATKTSDDDSGAMGVQCSGGVTVSGGKLDVTAAAPDGGVGISCEGNLAVTGGKLIAAAESGEGLSYPYGVRCAGNVKVSGGTLSASGATEGAMVGYGLYCAKGVEVAGGKLAASVEGPAYTDGLYCEGNLKVKGGELNATAKNPSSGAYPRVIACGKNVTVSGGAVNAKGGQLDCSGNLDCSGGTVTVAKSKVKAIHCKLLRARGGKVSVTGCSGIMVLDHATQGVISCNTVQVEGGKVEMSGCKKLPGIECKSFVLAKGLVSIDDQQSKNAVHVLGGNFKMTGGTLKVTKNAADAVYVEKGKSGGTLTVSGGSFTAKVTDASKASAVVAESASVKTACIKGIDGMLDAAGFTFEKNGDLYKVFKDGKGICVKDVGAATQGSSPAKTSASKVKFGGYTYRVSPLSLGKAHITLSASSFTYDGAVHKPKVKAVKTAAGTTLTAGKDFTVAYSAKSPKDAGTYTITLKGAGDYAGTSAKATYKIKQAANAATVKSTRVNKELSASTLKSKALTVALPKVTAAFGEAAWEVTTKDAKGVLSLKNGKVLVKKGAKAGTYTMKLKASVAKTQNYKAASTKVVTVMVTVK